MYISQFWCHVSPYVPITQEEAGGKEPIKEWEPLGPLLGGGDVGDVGVARQEEAHVPARTVLYYLGYNYITKCELM